MIGLLIVSYAQERPCRFREPNILPWTATSSFDTFPSIISDSTVDTFVFNMAL